VAYFGGGDRSFSTLDAVQPVAVLVGAFIEMDFVGTDDAIEDLGLLATSGCGGAAAFPPALLLVSLLDR